MNRNIILGLAMLATLGCVTPHVVPNTQAKDFHLTDLRSQRVAIFPIASADLDESASKTIADEYKNKSAFLDALSAKFSSRLAILDLDAKAVVWDGAIFADASSTIMKVTALHEVEEDLTAHFVNEVLGIK